MEVQGVFRRCLVGRCGCRVWLQREECSGSWATVASWPFKGKTGSACFELNCIKRGSSAYPSAVEFTQSNGLKRPSWALGFQGPNGKLPRRCWGCAATSLNLAERFEQFLKRCCGRLLRVLLCSLGSLNFFQMEMQNICLKRLKLFIFRSSLFLVTFLRFKDLVISNCLLRLSV